MTYYASEGIISTSQIDGGIQITAQQYQEAIYAIMDGKEIAVINDELILRDKKPSLNHEWVDDEWVDMTPDPEPIPEPEVIAYPSITASAKLTVDNGIMSGFATDSRIAGGFQIDTGVFMIFFTDPITSPYIVSTFDGGLFRMYVEPQNYADEYFIVTCTDLSGNPADPENMSVLIITT